MITSGTQEPMSEKRPEPTGTYLLNPETARHRRNRDYLFDKGGAAASLRYFGEGGYNPKDPQPFPKPQSKLIDYVSPEAQNLAIQNGEVQLLPGFLKGSIISPVLAYVDAYFNGKGDEDDMIELNEKTYADFNRLMYKMFLEKRIPGQVEYPVPSFEDVQAVLNKNQNRALLAQKWTQLGPQKPQLTERNKVHLLGV